MTCKECISFHVCGKSHRRQFPEEKGAEYTCKHFTDKDLINRLQAENTELLGKIEDLEANRVELLENIEQLESVITQIKAEAYKEFAEKLLLCYEGFDEVNEVITYQNLVTAVNDTLKEMVGEDNA